MNSKLEATNYGVVRAVFSARLAEAWRAAGWWVQRGAFRERPSTPLLLCLLTVSLPLPLRLTLLPAEPSLRTGALVFQ